jgi:drug/metabolite transporter (DMT)-like permease
MSLAVAIPFGVLSGLAYGASTAVQHSAAAASARSSESGRDVDAGGLLRLLRDPRWLLSLGGDSLGLIAQIIALATGPVVLIQPLLVIAVPVSLPVAYWLGGPRPRARDLLGCLAIVVGLGGFLILLGSPGDGRPPTLRAVVYTMIIALGAGGLLLAAVLRSRVVVRAGVFAGVSGAWFGLAGVLLNAVAIQVRHQGWGSLFSEPIGVVSLIALLLFGGLGMALVQLAFQIGSLAASFPANEAAAPVAAVIMGALVLHQRVPAGAGRIVGYLVCLTVIVVAIARLAIWAERSQNDATMNDPNQALEAGG